MTREKLPGKREKHKIVPLRKLNKCVINHKKWMLMRKICKISKVGGGGEFGLPNSNQLHCNGVGGKVMEKVGI